MAAAAAERTGRDDAMRVDWVLLDQVAQARVQAGDLVSVEAGGAPIYRVLRLAAGRAWLRDEVRAMDCIAPLSQFHWKACVCDG
jgi:hypothetical protein